MTNDSKTPNPEVAAKAKRRRFSAKYKLRVLRETDALADTGGVGEFLRREGLYHSTLQSWRAARKRGELDGLSAKKRGPKASPDRAVIEESGRQEREIAKLKKQLAQAEAIIAIQKKVATLLASPFDDEENDS